MGAFIVGILFLLALYYLLKIAVFVGIIAAAAMSLRAVFNGKKSQAAIWMLVAAAVIGGIWMDRYRVETELRESQAQLAKVLPAPIQPNRIPAEIRNVVVPQEESHDVFRWLTSGWMDNVYAFDGAGEMRRYALSYGEDCETRDIEFDRRFAEARLSGVCISSVASDLPPIYASTRTERVSSDERVFRSNGTSAGKWSYEGKILFAFRNGEETILDRTVHTEIICNTKLQRYLFEARYAGCGHTGNFTKNYLAEYMGKQRLEWLAAVKEYRIPDVGLELQLDLAESAVKQIQDQGFASIDIKVVRGVLSSLETVLQKDQSPGRIANLAKTLRDLPDAPDEVKQRASRMLESIEE